MPGAKVCRPFALGGWCDRGYKCTYRHVYECPDFVDYGSCPRGASCKLSHKKKEEEGEEEKVQLNFSSEEESEEEESEEEEEEEEQLYMIDVEGSKLKSSVDQSSELDLDDDFVKI